MREARRRYAEWCLCQKSQEKKLAPRMVYQHGCTGFGEKGLVGGMRLGCGRRSRKGGGFEGRGGREGEEERERRREENFGQAFSDVTWLLGALYFVRTYSSTTVYCSCSNCSAMVAGAGDLLLAGAVQVEIPTYTLGRLPPSTA
jgi:hypothetical protein